MKKWFMMIKIDKDAPPSSVMLQYEYCLNPSSISPSPRVGLPRVTVQSADAFPPYFRSLPPNHRVESIVATPLHTTTTTTTTLER
jgi:hypothetical protein